MAALLGPTLQSILVDDLDTAARLSAALRERGAGRVRFVSRRDGSRGLFVISAAGGEMRRIQTAGAGNATEPDWSPDGSTIVFTTQVGANSFDICTVPAAGGAVTSLVSGEDPSWAPNSRTVVFARRSGAGQKVLSLLDVPTKRVKDAARVSGSAAQPSWTR